ncbi:hypothetical protein JCM14635_00290 [Megalodesulfovibrio paquesii]
MQSKPLTPTQRAVLCTIESFAQAKRYLGLMPRHVVVSLSEEDVHCLESQGLVAWDAAVNPLGSTVEGLRLTPCGQAAVQPDAPCRA